MADTSRLVVLLPLKATQVLWAADKTHDTRVPEPVATRLVQFDSTRQISDVIVEAFAQDLAKSGDYGGGWLPSLFEIHIAAQQEEPLYASGLVPVHLWEDASGLVNFTRLSPLNGHLSADDLDRSYAAGYLKQDPQIIYATPVQGIGSAGAPELIELLSNLAWLGVGLILGEGVTAGKRILKEHQITAEARRMARSFEERGIRAFEAIRLWANTRESWRTEEASRKLGVSVEMMEEIFGALGYVQRNQDDTWRIGRLEEFLRKQQEWIDAEPGANRVAPLEPSRPDDQRLRRTCWLTAARRLFFRR